MYCDIKKKIEGMQIKRKFTVALWPLKFFLIIYSNLCKHFKNKI